MSGTSSIGKNTPPEALDYSLFDKGNPYSLINILPERLIPILERVRRQLPQMFHRAEKDLRKILKPEERDERMRLAFWDEYNSSTMLKKRMSLQVALNNIMSMDTWVNLFETDDRKMLWIFTPPKSYANSMKYILHLGMEQLQKLMSLPFYDPKTRKVDTKAAMIVLKAFQLVDLRVKGSIIQNININQKNLNLNADVTQEQLAEKVESQIGMLTLDELERLDRKLERVEKSQEQLIGSLPAEDQKEILEIKAELDDDKQEIKFPDLAEYP